MNREEYLYNGCWYQWLPWNPAHSHCGKCHWEENDYGQCTCSRPTTNGKSLDVNSIIGLRFVTFAISCGKGPEKHNMLSWYDYHKVRGLLSWTAAVIAWSMVCCVTLISKHTRSGSQKLTQISTPKSITIEFNSIYTVRNFSSPGNHTYLSQIKLNY